jgi:hypothetical protein
VVDVCIAGGVDRSGRGDVVRRVRRGDRDTNDDVKITVTRVSGEGVDDRELVLDRCGLALPDEDVPRRRREGLDVEVVVGDVLTVGAEAVCHERALVEVHGSVRAREMVRGRADL